MKSKVWIAVIKAVGQAVITIVTAVLTTLGTQSCVGHSENESAVRHNIACVPGYHQEPRMRVASPPCGGALGWRSSLWNFLSREKVEKLDNASEA